VEQKGVQVNITFTDVMGIPKEFFPKPASSSIPDWYKNMDSYMAKGKIPDGNGMTTATIKRCMPVFDAISNGYILHTYADVYIKQVPIDYVDKEHFEKTKESRFLSKEEVEEKGMPTTQAHYEWPSFGPIQFHPVEQAPNHPNRNGTPNSYPKWINPWSVKTPKGYSTLFIQPMHRESVFTILPGIVDTDEYDSPVNFPFVLNDPKFEGMIPAGTPMAQIIPVKRDAWSMKIGTEEDLEHQKETTIRLRTSIFDSYKNKFRQLKEYK